MSRQATFASLLLTLGLAGCLESPSSTLDLDWTEVPDRPWTGSDLWANRIQDWEVQEGKLTASSTLPMRTAHILTRRLAPEEGEAWVTMTMGLITDDEEGEAGPSAFSAPGETLGEGAGGILVGAGGPGLDYRRTALIHHSPGPGGGLFLGLDLSGHLVVSDFSDGNRIMARSVDGLSHTDSVKLRIRVERDTGSGEGTLEDGFLIYMEAQPLRSGETPITLTLPGLDGARIAGGLALVSHGGADGRGMMWTSHLRVEGPGVGEFNERRLGPVLGAQHIVSRKVLTMTAQLFPISPLTPGPGTAGTDTVLLEMLDESGTWSRAGEAPVVVPGYTATFRLEEWSGTEPVPYRLSVSGDAANTREGFYLGTIPPEPQGEGEFLVAAFTGNHNVASPGVDQGSFDWNEDLWFPHEDIVSHVQAHGPDFLFFSGDQVYEGASPTRADYQRPYEDYLYKWYLWLWAFRDLTGNLPAVTVPDDHDVFHGNVWGDGGKATPPGLTGAAAQDQGGYRLPPDWVNMVQRTQTSHLPTPWSPPSPDQEIGAYFTDVLYGGVSFAVLEDRKFKSPPKLFLPQADVWNGWAQNTAFHAPTEADAPGASLLGTAQEEFLEEWASDWTGGAWMKVALSQTIFGNVASIPADAMSGSVIPSLPIPEPGAYVEGDKPAADMDSNGWPPSGRNRALRAMRKGFTVHLAGDQHLASTIQYGVDGFRDGPFALCVPSVANFWPRRWYPPQPGGNRDPDDPAYTGDFLDGFGNPMTVFAVSNPARWGREPTTLHDRAPGYGIARFSRATREVSLEAWPRWADPGSGESPYPGWPVHFRQEDGYGKEPYGYLPTLMVNGLSHPVVQVISESTGDLVYAIRAQGSRFTPMVFEPGSYTLRVGEPGTEAMRTFSGLEPAPDSTRNMEVGFDGGRG